VRLPGYNFFLTMKNILILISIFFNVTHSFATGYNPPDTAKKILFAELKKNTEPTYIVKEANISFPEILKGNEDESLNYIEKFSETRRGYLIRTFNKGKKLFPKAEKILKKYNLPTELKILLALESGFDPNAVSRAGAVGYWQIMDAVAKEYGLKYVPQLSEEEKKKIVKANPKMAEKIFKIRAKQKDDRKNFIRSTTTAARYFKDRYHNLGDDWLLIVASYNCGVGNVWDAMQKSHKTNPTFWDIKKYLPAETRTYVMNFLALNVIFHNYDLFVKNRLTFSPEKIPANDFDQNISSEIKE
jgi:membrane-bound lytic murein transglycosylase D